MSKNKPNGWDGFTLLCTKIRHAKEFDRFFELFFTIEERESLAARFLIIRELLDGRLTQREIATKFKVSIAQITRGSNALKVVDDELKQFLKKHLTL